MSLVKICPKCGEKNEISALVCSKCKVGLFSVQPTEEKEANVPEKNTSAKKNQYPIENSIHVKPTMDKHLNDKSLDLEGYPTVRVKPSAFIRLESADTHDLIKIELFENIEEVFGRGVEKYKSVIGKYDTISRNHCSFRYSNGIFEIWDNDSTNGTYINGVKCEHGKKYQLSLGSKIQCADHLFIIKELGI